MSTTSKNKHSAPSGQCSSSVTHPSHPNLPRPSARSPPSSLSLTVRTGLFECHHFLAPNEYSDKTLGLLAFLVRQSVGEINFSSIMDEVQRRGLEGSAHDYVKLLEEKRMSLLPSDVSIGKCLMLNRLISHIEKNEVTFRTLIDVIRADMRLKMEDQSSNQLIDYPTDFVKRKHDFEKRRNAQEMRRLFYISHKDGMEPPSLIHLQNRTTEHLNYLLACKMRPHSITEKAGLEEFLGIITNSFMITEHPHCGGVPVTIHRPTKSRIYRADIKVTIVSLLHDFMEQHPGVIELIAINIALKPASASSELQTLQSIPWKVCELENLPEGNDSSGHFAQKQYSFQFSINLHIHLSEHHLSTPRMVVLLSLPIAIGNNTVQIPRLLAGVILSDIQRHSKLSQPDIRMITNYLVRHFVHRTGVLPNRHLSTFLQNELTKAQAARAQPMPQATTVEEQFTDFVTSYLNQVRFMAKHPVLAMLYAEELFLGICDSEQVAAVITASSMLGLPVVAFRMNTIRIDYATIRDTSVVGRSIAPGKCAIRMDAYSYSKAAVENFTLSKARPLLNLKNLVHSSTLPNATLLRVLSRFDQNTGQIVFQSFDAWKGYDNIRLEQLSEPFEPYQPLVDVFSNLRNIGYVVQSSDVNDQQNQSYNPPTAAAVLSVPVHDGEVNTAEAVAQRGVPTFNAMTSEMLVEYVLASPELLAEVSSRYRALQLLPAQASGLTDQLLSQGAVQHSHMQTQGSWETAPAQSQLYSPNEQQQSQYSCSSLPASCSYEQEQLLFPAQAQYQEQASAIDQGAALPIHWPNDVDHLLQQDLMDMDFME